MSRSTPSSSASSSSDGEVNLLLRNAHDAIELARTQCTGSHAFTVGNFSTANSTANRSPRVLAKKSMYKRPLNLQENKDDKPDEPPAAEPQQQEDGGDAAEQAKSLQTGQEGKSLPAVVSKADEAAAAPAEEEPVAASKADEAVEAPVDKVASLPADENKAASKPADAIESADTGGPEVEAEVGEVLKQESAMVSAVVPEGQTEHEKDGDNSLEISPASAKGSVPAGGSNKSKVPDARNYSTVIEIFDVTNDGENVNDDNLVSEHMPGILETIEVSIVREKGAPSDAPPILVKVEGDRTLEELNIVSLSDADNNNMNEMKELELDINDELKNLGIIDSGGSEEEKKNEPSESLSLSNSVAQLINAGNDWEALADAVQQDIKQTGKKDRKRQASTLGMGFGEEESEDSISINVNMDDLLKDDVKSHNVSVNINIDDILKEANESSDADADVGVLKSKNRRMSIEELSEGEASDQPPMERVRIFEMFIEDKSQNQMGETVTATDLSQEAAPMPQGTAPEKLMAIKPTPTDLTATKANKAKISKDQVEKNGNCVCC